MQHRETPRGVSLIPRLFEARRTGSLSTGAVEAMTDHPAFNPDNVDALVRNMPDHSLAMALVRAAASDEPKGTPASRVNDLLEKRLEEVRAQLNGDSDIA